MENHQSNEVLALQESHESADLLKCLGDSLYVLRSGNVVSLKRAARASDGSMMNFPAGCIGVVNECRPHSLGDPSFMADHGTSHAYMAGAMAGGISSEALVIALGLKGYLGSFGAGGLSQERIEEAIVRIKRALPNGPYTFNVLHSPGDPEGEDSYIDLLIRHSIFSVEASAYIEPSTPIIYYRAKGLSKKSDGSINRKHRIIAKVSRIEVAKNFLNPAPEKILKQLVTQGRITAEQANLASHVSIADDLTVEGDSGGHTDNRILSCILREMMEQRDAICRERSYAFRPRIGAAGGISTPHAVLSAFSMGASYVVTGSINQACAESGTSSQTKALLARARTSDVAMAPSADMFEMGSKVQVLTNGSMYAVRAQKLYTLYKKYDSLNDIPETEQAQLEKQIFKQPLQQIWHETVQFFHDQGRSAWIEAVKENSKKQMALVFQSYLGRSSRWAVNGQTDRSLDYQIWCGPSMGAANDWLRGTPYEAVQDRFVARLAEALMLGAAYIQRVNALSQMRVTVPHSLTKYVPGIDDSLGCMSVPSGKFLDKEERVTMDTDSKLNLIQSKNFYKQCWEVLPGGTHYNFGDPERPLIIPFNRAKNSRVWDLDGNEHLDLFCKFGALFVGHKNEAYHESLVKYMEKVTSVDICDLEVEVCSQMIRHIPCAEMIRFCLSGTEAVQNALRLARGYTGKNRFIRFHGHYHGNSDNIMGWRKSKDLSYPIPESFKGDLLDTLGRADGVMEAQSFLLPWNDIKILEATLEKFHKEIAAVLMEPICINGGGIFPNDGYLERTKELCEKYNVILIFDEIITGVRLGLSGAQGLLGVTPHLSTFGKALAGGAMPVSAIAGQRDIMNLYTRGKVIHAGTFNGYPLGLAAVKATFDLIEQDPECYARMARVTEQISKAFVRAADANDLPLVVQGLPTALVYHSQSEPVDRSEGYSDKVKFCDIIIREISKRYGIQFSPLSRIYANLLMNQDDVRFFEERIGDALANAKRVIDITFKETEPA